MVLHHFEYTAEMCDCRLCLYYNRKKKCTVSQCPCVEERIIAGTADRSEVMAETMKNIRSAAFRRRLNQFIRESEEPPMNFRNEKHRLAFDEAIRKAVEEHNEMCRIITEIGEMRKAANPIVTGYEFHLINLVSYVCPTALILPYLRETLEELKTREPDAKSAFRARVAIVGSEIDDPNLTKLIEGCGALVVSDRYCFGSKPGREVIELNDEEDVLWQICRHYMEVSECARYISDEKVHQRRETSDHLAKEFGAEGIIYEQMKYCDYWGFERALVSHIMHDEYGWPVLSIDRLYNNGNSGQLRTRVQAFVESLEIKRIHKEEGK